MLYERFVLSFISPLSSYALPDLMIQEPSSTTRHAKIGCLRDLFSFQFKQAGFFFEDEFLNNRLTVQSQMIHE